MSKYPEYKQLNLAQIGQEVMEEWKAKSTFEKSVSTREGKPSFTFYEGPPSAMVCQEFTMLWVVRLKIYFVASKPYKDSKYTEKRAGTHMDYLLS